MGGNFQQLAVQPNITIICIFPFPVVFSCTDLVPFSIIMLFGMSKKIYISSAISSLPEKSCALYSP
jgi:hypothetical protein